MIGWPDADPASAAAARRYPQRPIVGVGGAVLVGAGDRPSATGTGVVLIKRRFAPLAGRWSLPGGTLELGETLTDGLAREMFEETGLTVEVGPVVEVFDRITRDEHGVVEYHYVLVDFVCWPTGGALQPGSDVSDALVADADDLDRFGLTAKALEVIAQARRLSASLGRPS